MRYKVKSAEFKHPIKIQRLKEARDEDNRPIPLWSDLLDTRAKIIVGNGREFIEIDGVMHTVSKIFQIRGLKSIEFTGNDRILFNNKAYNILNVKNVEEMNVLIEFRTECVE